MTKVTTIRLMSTRKHDDSESVCTEMDVDRNEHPDLAAVRSEIQDRLRHARDWPFLDPDVEWNEAWFIGNPDQSRAFIENYPLTPLNWT